MEDWATPATTYLTDWSTWNWYATSAVILISAVIVALVVYATVALRYEGVSTRWFVILPTGVLTIIAALCLLGLPGTLMRHIEHHEGVWWVVGPLVLLAIAFALIGLVQDNPGPFVAAIGLVAGVIFGAISDALDRAAASIPTSVPLMLLGVGAIVAYVMMSNRSRA